ncbi:amino acid permease [Sporolactobacillus vineae]|uniref:amino acid permease n=1 Tax=Sporolactobacillus vineae TaxID=444463 RepID=UPI000287BFF2|nr:amino acid permease [Sporolactobacillus vineae]
MNRKNTLNIWLLTALVVGNMVGSAIFMLPRTLAETASPGGTLLAWGMTGCGVLFIAMVYGILAERKPELTGGPQVYAKALFSEGSERSRLTGYFVTWGYSIANFVGNVAVITTFSGYLATFFPVLSSRTLLPLPGLSLTWGHFLNFLVCSALLWFVYFLILKGVQGASKINFVATAAKVIGFVLFIAVALFVFQVGHLIPFTTITLNGSHPGMMNQADSAAVMMLWAFIGIESAVAFSARAKNRRDVKWATIIGLLVTLFIYIAITLLVMGALTRHDLLLSTKPLVDALAEIIGAPGAYILGFLALVSLFGSSIGWIMLSAEVPYQAARQGYFFRAMAVTNRHGTASRSLLLTCIVGQFFIFSTLLQSISDAFDFVSTVATLSYLVPYIFAAVYLLKLVVSGEGYERQPRQRVKDGLIGAVAAAYTLWIIKAGTGDAYTFWTGIGMILSGILFYPLIQRYKLGKQPAGDSEDLNEKGS